MSDPGMNAAVAVRELGALNVMVAAWTELSETLRFYANGDSDNGERARAAMKHMLPTLSDMETGVMVRDFSEGELEFVSTIGEEMCRRVGMDWERSKRTFIVAAAHALESLVQDGFRV